MLNIFGENYYLDLDKINDYVQVTPPEGYTGSPENYISTIKYDMVRILVETLVVENEEVDESMGLKNSDSSIPFKLAFNTLMYKKLINKI